MPKQQIGGGGAGGAAAPPSGPTPADTSTAAVRARKSAEAAATTVRVIQKGELYEVGQGPIRFDGAVVSSVAFDPAEGIVIVTLAGAVKHESFGDFGLSEEAI